MTPQPARQPQPRPERHVSCNASRAGIRACVPITSDGSPYARFRRALKTRNLNLIRAAAAEQPQVRLEDALEVCLVVRERQPDRFEAAAVRWIGRYCSERRELSLELVDAAVAAFRELQRDPEAGLERLQVLAAR